jgi:hypothetical protein
VDHDYGIRNGLTFQGSLPRRVPGCVHVASEKVAAWIICSLVAV